MRNWLDDWHPHTVTDPFSDALDFNAPVQEKHAKRNASLPGQPGRSGGRPQGRKHVANAEEAAREMGWLSLVDALAYGCLVAEVQPERFDRVAVRWHGRLELEASGLTLRESEAALALLASLPNEPEAGRLLRRLLGRARPTPRGRRL